VVSAALRRRWPLTPTPHRRPPWRRNVFGRAVAEEESALMARVLMGGVGRVARWPTRQVASALRRGRPLAPPRACRPPGAAIVFSCRRC
jgi:hypothetical protein